MRLLGHELPQGFRRLAADAFDEVGDLVARLELRTAGSQVPPKPIVRVLFSRRALRTMRLPSRGHYFSQQIYVILDLLR
jgi:hypothetical protein